MFQLFSIPDLKRYGNPVVLASASPRRREFLSAYGIECKFFAPDVVEQHEPGETPEDYVQRNALLKAREVAGRHPADTQAALILASDTVVVSNSGKILEKPQNTEEAVATLQSLSGTTHRVISSLVFCYGSTGSLVSSQVIETIVEFSLVPAAWIANYVATLDPLDKAGSYGIQGIAGAFVRRIEGSYTNVVGLPLNECLHMLQSLLPIRSFYLSIEHGSDPKQVLLRRNRDCIVAISKKQGAEGIRFAHLLGQRHFGENYLQELQRKSVELADLPGIIWHFTGSIQSNKIKEIAKIADVVHSLESIEKARMLNQVCRDHKRTIKVFVKIATTGSTQASGGCSWEEGQAIADYLNTASNLEWQGFMGMGPAHNRSSDLLELYLQFMSTGLMVWQACGRETSALRFSLGMSGDFDVACQAAEQLKIELPWLRIGSAIFGER